MTPVLNSREEDEGSKQPVSPHSRPPLHSPVRLRLEYPSTSSADFRRFTCPVMPRATSSRNYGARSDACTVEYAVTTIYFCNSEDDGIKLRRHFERDEMMYRISVVKTREN